jgi:hypothetical protein
MDSRLDHANRAHRAAFDNVVRLLADTHTNCYMFPARNTAKATQILVTNTLKAWHRDDWTQTLPSLLSNRNARAQLTLDLVALEQARAVKKTEAHAVYG